jgi:hypothetical protein
LQQGAFRSLDARVAPQTADANLLRKSWFLRNAGFDASSLPVKVDEDENRVRCIEPLR